MYPKERNQIFCRQWDINSFSALSYTKYNFITGQCVLDEIMCEGLV